MRKIIILVLAGTLVLGTGILALAQADRPPTKEGSDDDSESEEKGRRRWGRGFEWGRAVERRSVVAAP